MNSPLELRRPEQGVLTKDNDLTKTEETLAVVDAMLMA